ncbi:hypothetical protein Lal_00038858 [Lupinus albus]|nr:hypothetical protein Lal_00038858 [Lupinus albus]
MVEAISVNVSPSSNSPREEENINIDAANSSTPNSFSTGSSSSTHTDTPRLLFFQEFNMVVVQTEFYYPSIIGQNHIAREPYIKQVFDDAIEVLTKGGYETLDRWNLADAFNTLGNRAMDGLCYVKAVDMYSCAVALWKNNPIFLCNRGAALTKICKFWDSTFDCYEAIRLEPRYVLAYYRLGCAYFESGKYIEAIREGFIKGNSSLPYIIYIILPLHLFLETLQLDPNNDDVLTSIERAETKIREEASKMRAQVYRILIPRGKRPSEKLAWVSPQSSAQEKSFKGKGLAY